MPSSEGGSGFTVRRPGPSTVSSDWLWYWSEICQKPFPRSRVWLDSSGARSGAGRLQSDGPPVTGRGRVKAMPGCLDRSRPSSVEQSRTAPWPPPSSGSTAVRGVGPVRSQTTNELERAYSSRLGGGVLWNAAAVVIA
jgi:hypothetical protein